MAEQDQYRLGEPVERLGAGASGRWLIRTQGTRHVWDLDANTYTRLPGEAAQYGKTPLDGVELALRQVTEWPRTGSSSVVICKDPSNPDPANDFYFASSEIVAIRPILD